MGPSQAPTHLTGPHSPMLDPAHPHGTPLSLRSLRSPSQDATLLHWTPLALVSPPLTLMGHHSPSWDPIHLHRTPLTLTSPPLHPHSPPGQDCMGRGHLPLLHELPDGRHGGPGAQVGVIRPLVLLHDLLCRGRKGGNRDFRVCTSAGCPEGCQTPKFPQIEHFCMKKQRFFGRVSP